METIGKCPVCSVGSVIACAIGYQCSQFKSPQENCSFTLFRTYFGKEITPALARTLLEHGETACFNDLVTKEGKPFTAALALKDGLIRPVFQSTPLDAPCPKCARRMLVTTRGFACEDFFDTKTCDYYMPRSVAGITLTETEAELLLAGGQTDYRDDFIGKAGGEFGARLTLTENFQTAFIFSLAACPKCKNGHISNNTTAYGCSEYKGGEDGTCDFTIWRSIQGRYVSVQNALDICTKGHTSPLKFKSQAGTVFIARLVLDPESFKVALSRVENPLTSAAYNDLTQTCHED